MRKSPRRQTVNLSPSDRRKDNPGLDLAIAVALLVGHDALPQETVDGVMLWGELALDGADVCAPVEPRQVLAAAQLRRPLGQSGP